MHEGYMGNVPAVSSLSGGGTMVTDLDLTVSLHVTHVRLGRNLNSKIFPTRSATGPARPLQGAAWGRNLRNLRNLPMGSR